MPLWAEAAKWLLFGMMLATGHYLADSLLTWLDPFGLYEDDKD